NISTVLTYDAWRVVAEWNSAGNLAATNVYGIGSDEILLRWSSDYSQLYYKTDAYGNIAFIVNSSGAIVEKYTYDVFGSPIISDGGGTVIGTSSNYGNRFMFKGREYFSALGLYDFRRRTLHPGLGKFMQADPIGFAGDPLNLFRFCNHNPMIASDPLGTDWL